MGVVLRPAGEDELHVVPRRVPQRRDAFAAQVDVVDGLAVPVLYAACSCRDGSGLRKPPPLVVCCQTMSSMASPYLRLRSLVLDGELLPGAHLVEIPLARRLGVSRPTVREALRRLEGDALVVSDGRALRVAGLAADERRSALLMRSALEALHAGLAAERVGDGEVAPAELRRLGAIADNAEQATNGGDFHGAMIANRAFHQGIDELAASPLSAAAIERVWDLIIISAEQSLVPPGRTTAVSAEHRGLLDAISDGDPTTASELARNHVLATLVASGVADD